MCYACDRLLKGWGREELKKYLQMVLPLNSKYCDNAMLKANEVLRSCRENLKSLKDNPSSQHQVNQWKKSVRDKGWGILRVTLTFPLLGKFFNSSLRPVLVKGK